MIGRLNKTSICSVIFLDIVGYSEKSVAEQIECKERFNSLISSAIMNIAPNDRIILDTGDGAAISLMGAPEEALFVALTIRDSILDSNRQATTQLLVRIGINLGPVRVVKDINDHPNIIGDGINVAQRVMSFAEPNHILVSRSYYEIVSRLSSEITHMFSYSGVKTDKHVREHEVYLVSTETPDSAVPGTRAEMPEPPAKSRDLRKYWIATAAIIAAVASVVGIKLIGSLPAEQPHASQPAVPIAPAQADRSKDDPVAVKPEKKTVAAEKPAATSKTTKSQARQKTTAKTSSQQTSVSRNKPEPEKSGDSSKTAQEPKGIPCTDAQRMLHQCN